MTLCLLDETLHGSRLVQYISRQPRFLMMAQMWSGSSQGMDIYINKGYGTVMISDVNLRRKAMTISSLEPQE